MPWRLSEGYKMAVVTVGVGLVLLVLNMQAIQAGSSDALGLVSLSAAVFVVALGLALLFRKSPTE